jgi:hypothetical protein
MIQRIQNHKEFQPRWLEQETWVLAHNPHGV